VKLARYYMEKRAIPKRHLLELRLSDKEWSSREDYDRDVVSKVREFLKKIDPRGNIRCLVTMYGLPLKISPPEMRKEEKVQLEELRKIQRAIAEGIKAVPKEENEKRKLLESDLNAVLKQIHSITKEDYGSAFDSELALVRVEGYNLSQWIPNPMFIGFRNDSAEVEMKGLEGNAYFDARWPKLDEEKVKKAVSDSAAFYDQSIHLAAERIGVSGRMPVVINDKQQLFEEGEGSDAALYCGWYSLSKYIDAFSWKPGAIGYHIASMECSTLKSQNSQVWCKRMLEKGVAATIGPVNEPYLQAFTVPEVFFGLLVEGKLTLAECYALSTPYLSWQMVLIGDPLYRPFRKP
jgi:hypothetical protein